MNHYSPHIESFLNRILELRHVVSQLRVVLNGSIKSYEKLEGIDNINSSRLIITDWTDPKVNGHNISFRTVARRVTPKETYNKEVERILSQEYCYAVAQSFEALERFMKDCLYTKISSDLEFRQALSIVDIQDYKRQRVPGGEELFRLLKKACGAQFNIYSNNNNVNLKFKELWTILSEVRHSIVHSSSIIKREKLQKSEYHYSIFTGLFGHSEIDSDRMKIELIYNQLSDVLNVIAEFGFQIYKLLSLKERLDWEISISK